GRGLAPPRRSRARLGHLAGPDVIRIRGDALQIPTARDAQLRIEDLRVGAGARGAVLALEQQPLAPIGLALAGSTSSAHQMKAAAQLLALQLEVDAPAAQRVLGVALRLPGAAIPEQHRAAAVLSLRDHAFKIAVLERVILGLHGQAFHARIEARPLRHGPAQEHAVELQPKVVVQAASIVLLHHESVTFAAPLLAPRLPGARKVALFSIGLE